MKSNSLPQYQPVEISVNGSERKKIESIQDLNAIMCKGAKEKTNGKTKMELTNESEYILLYIFSKNCIVL
jgi:hypothetical protein